MSYLCYRTSPSPQAFAVQLRWLRENRDVVSVSEGLARTEQVTWRLAAGTVVLTFEEDVAGLYDRILPLLLRNRLPAAVFVRSQGLSSTAGLNGGRLQPDHVREIAAAGFEVGSLGHSAPDLTELSEEECRLELETSREILSEVVGHPVRLLAYPGGRHDLAVRRAADAAGYTYAFSLPARREEVCSLAIPRVEVGPADDEAALRVKTAAWYLPLRMSATLDALERGWRSLEDRVRELAVPRG